MNNPEAQIAEARAFLEKQPGIRTCSYKEYEAKVQEMGDRAVFLTIHADLYPNIQFHALQLDEDSVLLAGDY